MGEQIFSDAGQVLIVRLGDELLTFEPSGRKGWQCRVDDICWTSSVLSSRGIQEVNLHGPGGRVAVTLLHFEHIERFYLALLARLAARPKLKAVRRDLPARVTLLERVIWLAHHSQEEEDGVWQTLVASGNGVAVATTKGLLLASEAEPHAERILWGELAGVRIRVPSPYVPRPSVRFFRADSYVDLGLSETPNRFFELCRRRSDDTPGPRPVYAMPGVGCPDGDVAMTYSWELEEARAAGALGPGDVVVAAAFGRAGELAPGARALQSVGASAPAAKTIWILTRERLVRLEEAAGEEGPIVTETEIEAVRRLRRSGSALYIGDSVLETDSAQLVDMPGMFLHRYRKVFTDRFNPFADGPEAPAARAGRSALDPFSSELEVTIPQS